MKEATLVRKIIPGADMIEGTLSFGDRNIPTIERSYNDIDGDGLSDKNRSCYPPGVYILQKGYMASHNVNHYQVTGAPGRDGIFIHFINMLAKNPQMQLKGCTGASPAGIFAFESWGKWEPIKLTVTEVQA